MLIVIFLDDCSIGYLTPTSSDFLGLYGSSEFGSRIHSWREPPSGQPTRPWYSRVPDYSNQPFRLPKNPNRLTDPPAAESQRVLHSSEQGARRGRQCSPGWAACDAWDVSNNTRKRRSISAPPSPRSSGSYLHSWLSVSDTAQERAKERSLNSGSIYGALGGIRSKVGDSLPERASGSSAQSSKTMRGRPENNSLMPIKNEEQSILSGTSSYTAVASNGPLKTRHGLFGFRMEKDGSSACAIEDSDLRFGSGQSFRNMGGQVRAYIGPDKCAICQEDWNWGRSPEVAKFRDDCERILARLQCGHCFHPICLAIWFSQIGLAATLL